MAEQPLPIRRLVAELIVIVAGVLIALGVDAAWGHLTDRAREADLIADLVEEFRENRVRLSSDIEFNRRAEVAAQEWLEAVEDRAVLPPDSLEAFLFATAIVVRFDPLSGVLRSLIETGELALIREPALRHALAGWLGLVEEAALVQIAGGDRRSDLMPLLLEALQRNQPDQRDLPLLRLYRTYVRFAGLRQAPLLTELDRILGLLEEARE